MTWCEARVREMVHLVNGYPFDSALFSGNAEVPLVRIRDLTAHEFETYVPAPIPTTAELRNGDLVIGMDGDFNICLWTRGPAALNQRLCALRPRQGIDIRWVAYNLPPHLKYINETRYATTVKHLSSNEVLAIRFSLPGSGEQELICNFLDRETGKIDALIAKQERLIATLREDRTATVAEALEGLDAVRLRRLVDPERPMTYGILQCGEPVEDGIPYIGPSDMPGQGQSPPLAALRRTTNDIAASYRRSVLSGGDVVVSIGPAYGRVAVVGSDLTGANLTQDTVRVAALPSLVDTRYLVWVLLSRQTSQYWDMEITGATFRRLNLGTLALTPVPLPTLDEQRRIAIYLDEATAKVDALIAKASQVINILREYRSALITDAVTGKIDVRGAA